ncbi:hypothetical protein EYF80_062698 [Liparis tanakae]|uniref:Uncharacterized protein n=1 Tax=Liparis tanakae TaxID=230148 RepID=A0A4Z2EEF9_9TELE|nr:hypothetical protein EYF80_062698 [Liparis tanakae]
MRLGGLFLGGDVNINVLGKRSSEQKKDNVLQEQLQFNSLRCSVPGDLSLSAAQLLRLLLDYVFGEGQKGAQVTLCGHIVDTQVPVTDITM